MNSFNNKYCPGKDICGYFTYRWVPAHVLGGLKTFPLNTNIVQLQQECIMPDTIKRHSENQGRCTDPAMFDVSVFVNDLL